MAREEGRDPAKLGSALYHNININEDRPEGARGDQGLPRHVLHVEVLARVRRAVDDRGRSRSSAWTSCARTSPPASATWRCGSDPGIRSASSSASSARWRRRSADDGKGGRVDELRRHARVDRTARQGRRAAAHHGRGETGTGSSAPSRAGCSRKRGRRCSSSASRATRRGAARRSSSAASAVSGGWRCRSASPRMRRIATWFSTS